MEPCYTSVADSELHISGSPDHPDPGIRGGGGGGGVVLSKIIFSRPIFGLKIR